MAERARALVQATMNTFWQDRPVLVTGATGLLGGWVVRQALERSANVVCVIRDWVAESELVRSGLAQRVSVVRGDVRDQELLERVLGEYETASVFHLAAQTIVGVANANPISTFETNIAGTWALLEACRRSPKVKQIIVASSDKAYGEAKVLPYDETTPLLGRHPYDVSKSCADMIAQSYATTYGLPVVITRCGNFYGPGDLNWNRIVPGTIRSILRGTRPVIRSNGHYIRDYFYVEDGADTYFILAEKLAKDNGLTGEAFNFSNETRVSVLELVRRILSMMGSELEPVVRDQAGHEILNQRLSADKAKNMLGWAPRFTLEDGLLKTIPWYVDFLERKQSCGDISAGSAQQMR